MYCPYPLLQLDQMDKKEKEVIEKSEIGTSFKANWLAQCVSLEVFSDLIYDRS